MTLDLRTPAAVDRAETERERVAEKVTAFESFADRVAAVDADGGGRGVGSRGIGGRGTGATASGSQTIRSAGATLTVGASAGASNAGTSATETEAFRDAFRETVLPYADADAEPEALADELSPDLAAALAAGTGGVPPGLADRLVSRAETRREECSLLADAMAAERDRLREVGGELDAVVDWLVEADETSLLQLGFETLRERHDRLADLRATCDRLARERQATLRGTSRDGLTGVRERELLDHLYADFAVDHPVLADLAELDDLLADCQRAVRRHLCARV